MINENEFLLHAFFMGIYITFVYDILRIFRRVISHKSFWMSVEDIVFWIYCGAEVFLLMYHESNGSLRWFAVLGALTGMALYRKAVSPVFVKYVSTALRKIVHLLVKMIRLFIKPAAAAGKALSGTAARAGRSVFGRVRKLRRRLKRELTFFWRVLILKK